MNIYFYKNKKQLCHVKLSLLWVQFSQLRLRKRYIAFVVILILEYEQSTSNRCINIYIYNQESTDLIREAHMGMGDVSFSLFLIFKVMVMVMG